MKIAAIIGGCAFILIVLVDGFNTIIVARRTLRVFRPARLFYSVTWRWCSAIAVRIHSGRTRESFLAVYGPLSVLTLLAFWELGLIAGFGLIQWGIDIRADGHSLGIADVFYLSATTLLTLDTGHPQNAASKIVSTAEGGMGLGFLALMISYLPVLYQAYSNRELRITLLDARAGSPPSAAELLLFHSGNLDRLEQHLADWEEWAAELLETNLAFPMLAFFRSQHINQSWVSALITTLDAASVVAICGENRVKKQAKLTLAMGRHALVDIAGVFQIKPPIKTPDRLPATDFDALRNLLGETGAELSLSRLSPNELANWRQLYEPYAERLSGFLLIALPPWFPEESKRENWKRASQHNPDAFAVSDPYTLSED